MRQIGEKGLIGSGQLIKTISKRSVMNDPINPFSPICLIEPTLPQCKTYISGVGPANCPGVTINCKRELFRLNSTISLDLDFAIYVEHNLQCALQEIQPC